MHSTPAHKQTDPSRLPGQIVNPVGFSGNHDMMDDQSLYRFMNSRPRDREVTLGDYIRRKGERNMQGSIETHEGNAKSYTEVMSKAATSAEEKQAVLDGQAFCSRVIDGPPQAEWKPGRDVPAGWDHV